ncbi:MAG TPA: M20/M25/M40 family metallo-hydrolase [Phnomibacter sp.]|nr:M20/M25/M40 family metallo-hydrolase [Phnomibacter sp.]
MRKPLAFFTILPLIFMVFTSGAQPRQAEVVAAIVQEATTNSHLKKLGHELMDKIGPRLVGSPQMQKAHQWAVANYANWGIEARNETWGQWRGWERGITHIDMLAPWVRSLEGTQLAWCPSTKGKAVVANCILLPQVADSLAFQQWLPAAKGKFVLISMHQPTGRPDYNWEEFALKPSFEKLKKERSEQQTAWAQRLAKTGLSARQLALALENAGAAGIVASYWSNGFGVNKIFSAHTTKIPTVDIALEDYGLLYRLIENGETPRLSIQTDSKELGMVPTYNTVAEIKGKEKPGEYVMLSAHFDSWDGGTGATDNGTGTLVMMEAMRILKKVYPNPKRTILVGHWGSEEQGLNGSRAFVEDHPEIVDNLQALFNQDNGTGRIANISGAGFLHAYEYITRWLSAVPAEYKQGLETRFPGTPAAGGSDNASFVAAGAPAFSLSSLSWSYGNYTWHTNRDTYDKIVWDDVQSNAILTAIMVYMACEDDKKTSRERIVLPINPRTGAPGEWPTRRSPTRKGGVD